MSYLFDGATPWDASRLASVKAHGGIAVSVYIVGSPGGMRCANAADVKLARSLGLGVLPNWERAADFFSTCTVAEAYNAGVEAAVAARRLGFPSGAGVGVAFSFDFQCPASRYAEMTEKLTQAGKGMGGAFVPLGYGQAGLCDYWAAHGIPGPHWLMASTWGEPYSISRNVALVQSHTVSGAWLNSPVAGTDINTITQPSKLAAWWPDGSSYGGNVNPADVWNYAATIWNKSKPSAWALLGNIHQTVHSIATVANSVARGVADIDQRVAALQADVAALKAQGGVQINPADLPVSGTVHIGGTS